MKANCSFWKVVRFYFSIIILFVINSTSSYSFQRGDIDGDGKIDLKEAVSALQVTAGIRAIALSKELHVPEDFATIQEAIDAAVDGDTIIIAAGTYNETLSTEKNDIALEGAGNDQTIIVGNGSDATLYFRYSKSVRIQDLTVKNGYRGVYLKYASCDIKRAIIENNEIGIAALWNSYVSVEDTQVRTNSLCGIQMRTSSSGYIGQSEVTDNLDIGVQVRNGSSAEIYQSSILRNSGTGLTGERGSSVDIRSSQVSQNGASGMLARINGHLIIEDCEILDNSLDGVEIRDQSSAIIYGNTSISNNANSSGSKAGITIFFNSYARINDATEIYNNKGPGIILSANSSFLAVSGSIHNNQGHGVDVKTESIADFLGTCPVTYNTGFGINCSDGKVMNMPTSLNDNSLGETNNCSP